MPTSPNIAEGNVARSLHAVVAQVPSSHENPAPHPLERAQRLTQRAALAGAAVSGTAALPPGPLGLATVLPDLLSIWGIQQQLVADIAAAYGKTATLTPEVMVFCLFRHADDSVSRMLLSRQGENVVFRRVANRTLQLLLEKIAVRVAQRVVTKGLARWLPIVGALGVGAHSFYDTSKVGRNAIELFSRPQQHAASPRATGSKSIHPGRKRKRAATKKRGQVRRRSARRVKA
ncbi:MAG: EcsC family protein [Opitutaceae bacterium]|nr:EcsC family protein [Opitutaceae bacterium]